MAALWKEVTASSGEKEQKIWPETRRGQPQMSEVPSYLCGTSKNVVVVEDFVQKHSGSFVEKTPIWKERLILCNTETNFSTGCTSEKYLSEGRILTEYIYYIWALLHQ